MGGGVLGGYCIDTALLVGLFIWNEILVLYFIITALLVNIHILCAQKWAAGCDPPLQIT